MNDLQKKLLHIQGVLKAPKNQYNKFAGFYYRNAEDILEALKPLLITEGLMQTISDKVINIGTSNYIEATVTVYLGEHSHSVTAYAREEEHLKGQIAAQITGGTSSYARKYALNGMYNIDDTNDVDSGNSQPAAPQKAAAPKQDELTVAKDNLRKTLIEFGHDNDVKMKLAINKILNKSTVNTVEEANEVLQALEDGAL